jgi:hypothetical protein
MGATAYGLLPIGPASKRMLVPPGTWTWRADRPGELGDADGKVLRIPSDTALVGEHGLWLHGKGGCFTVEPRSSDGAVSTERRGRSEAA